MEIRYKISSHDLYDMRKAVNWRAINLKQLEKALNNSMIVVGIYEENTIVATARLVGDYSCKGMLTDVIVKPEYQGKGYGKLVVT
ncbi:MAG: GNAT family N-acetyltransferase [Erysipelotrichaceae bacterium]|nr:GNAT family N-acetyltransferase [Erysipelotrichaceae bacterium]